MPPGESRKHRTPTSKGEKIIIYCNHLGKKGGKKKRKEKGKRKRKKKRKKEKKKKKKEKEKKRKKKKKKKKKKGGGEYSKPPAGVFEVPRGSKPLEGVSGL